MTNIFKRRAKSAAGATEAEAAARRVLVAVYDGGRTIFYGAVCDLPVNEHALLSKSIEFFNDPEPCYIHRSAVQARLYAEFGEWLESSRKIDAGRCVSAGADETGANSENGGSAAAVQTGRGVSAAGPDIYSCDINDMPLKFLGYFFNNVSG